MNARMHNSPAPLNDDQKAPADDKRWSIRALIVDDDVPIRELMIDYLARFNIHAAASPMAPPCVRRCKPSISMWWCSI